MNYTITLQDLHNTQIKNHLLRDDHKERVAFIICGISKSNSEIRFLSIDTVLLNEEQISSNADNVTFNNNDFISILKKIELKDLSIILVHNHPMHFGQFSTVDDEGEYHLFKLAYNRNNSINPFASLIMLPDGSLIGRAWKVDLTHSPISRIRVIGNSFKMYYPDRTKDYSSPEVFHRQQLAFGKALVQDFSKMKITIVGAGATGSATTILLTRLGVGELCLIDKDIIEESNLNRLYGATYQDIGSFKVEVLKKHIESIGLNTKVTALTEWVSAEKCVDHLKTSDFIFGCTDDNSGRIFLNRFAYFYLTPVIDMGLVISVKGDPPEIDNLQGRISYLFPGNDCLITKGIINMQIAYSENLQRNDEDSYKKLKAEAYVIGEGNPAPAVITFTTQIATMAVNELLNRIQQFNPDGILSPHKIIFFHRGIEIFPENIQNNDCRICGTKYYWGRGDMIPFLDMTI